MNYHGGPEVFLLINKMLPKVPLFVRLSFSGRLYCVAEIHPDKVIVLDVNSRNLLTLDKFWAYPNDVIRGPLSSVKGLVFNVLPNYPLDWD